MVHKTHFSAQWALPITVGICLLLVLIGARSVSALTPIPNPEPKPGSFGLEATKTKAAPTQGATITTPGGGASFSTSPIAVSGICPNDLLVQIYDNGVMVGSVMCKGGSFTIQVSLFAGVNELTALVYDELDQAGPPSNVVTVNYTDTRLTAFGSLITLTSTYARRSAAATSQLDWPLQLSGGTGPYAFSLDWGDASTAELKSQSLTGLVTIAHVYKKAGIYQTNIKVTDVNGVSAFLQVVALANGKAEKAAAEDKATGVSKPEILWIPTIVALILLLPSFWLGRLSQVTTLRNKMLRDQEKYKQK